MATHWRVGKRVAIVGGGPGGVSAALALIKQGFDVRIFEKQAEAKGLGGAVLLSVPVLAILRSYGIGLDNFGSYTTLEFRNNKGKVRARLPFNPAVEKSFGIKGWHYGVLRASAFAKMLECLPNHVMSTASVFSHYTETAQSVTLHFEDKSSVEADILIGADGINSKVSKQLFGDSQLFHIGLRVWLAWCDPIPGIAPHQGVISHSSKYQASYFPMLHDGKPGFEWWVVEAKPEFAPKPDNPQAYIGNILKDFADPLPRFAEATDFNRQVFCWDVYNRPSLQEWSKNRVMCIGDAAHPVSPYAAYGMGMAIEDGYFLAKFLQGKNLESQTDVTNAYKQFELERVAYVNHNVEFARKLGNNFHKLPWPLTSIRDLVFDNTKILNTMITKDYLGEQEAMCMSMTELHIKK